MKRFVLISAVLAGFAGCGGEEATLSQGETEQALSAMTAAASFGVATASADISSGNASVTVTGTCTEGGTIDIAGSITTGAAGASYDLELTYNACVFGGIRMDGTLSYSGSTTSGGATFSMTGDIAFAGTIQGTCSIDIDNTLSQTGVTLSGSACGNSVSVQLGAQQ